VTATNVDSQIQKDLSIPTERLDLDVPAVLPDNETA